MHRLTLHMWLATLVWASAAQSSGAPDSPETLVDMVFSPLPLGSIRPSGWLLGELQTMADGLAGHEHEFYAYVNDSRWLHRPGSGGQDYSGLNEAFPYWFNGLVPLAYSLGDEKLQDVVQKFASLALSHQAEDGWLGPSVGEARNVWEPTPFLLGLTQLAEADARFVGPAVSGTRRFMRLVNSMLHDNSRGFVRCNGTTTNCSWAQVRFADLVLSMQWLLETHPSEDDRQLWDSMRMLYGQSTFKWDAWYTRDTYQQVVANPTEENKLFPYLHGVNVGQGLKSSAVVRRFNRNESLIQSSFDAVNWTLTYHGAPSGTVLGDEVIRDLKPYAASELCTAVETARSLSYLHEALGLGYYADRAELVTYNAIPVMMTNDAWGHQYMAQPNQPWVRPDTRVFTDANHGMATVFGLEPEYPCCTVNFPQGWPKFLSHSWTKRGDSGLVHSLLSPSKVTTSIGNRTVTVECQTNYPFDHTLKYTVIAETAFDLHLRVPDWYVPEQSRVDVNGNSSRPLSPEAPGHVHKVRLPAGRSTVTYTLGVKARAEKRQNNAVSVYVGSLLYSLRLGASNSSTSPHPFNDPLRELDNVPFQQLRDYYMESTTAWNIAIDPRTLRFEPLAAGAELRSGVFDEKSAPTRVLVQGCEVQWGLYANTTPDVPPSLPECRGGVGEYVMIPYGAAKVHMSELPVINLPVQDL